MDADDFLAHYGVKGMKWGKRNPQNANYSDQQAKRDSQVYGTRGAKRINKAMNRGDQVSTARGDEKTRRDGVMAKNKYVRQGGKAAGAVAGGAAGYLAVRGLSKLANSEVGRKAVLKMMGSGTRNSFMKSTQTYHLIREGIDAYAGNPAIQALVTAGAAKVGHMLAGDAAVAVNMRAHGYDPDRR